MLNTFKPTYLMVKQHEITGLKYFCKTIRKNPYEYRGSGIFWNRHIKIYGIDNIKTIWCELFTNENDLIEFATLFSDFYDVVNSNEWANLIIEDGLTGFLSENSKIIQKERIKNKTHHFLSGNIQKAYQLNRVENGTHVWLSGDQQRKVQNALVLQNKHRFCNSDYQRNVSINSNAKRLADGSHNAIQIYKCPHCDKSGKGLAMFRHHFNNCKRANDAKQ